MHPELTRPITFNVFLLFISKLGKIDLSGLFFFKLTGNKRLLLSSIPTFQGPPQLKCSERCSTLCYTGAYPLGVLFDLYTSALAAELLDEALMFCWSTRLDGDHVDYSYPFSVASLREAVVLNYQL